MYLKNKFRSNKKRIVPGKVHNSVKFLNMFWEDMFEQQENNFVFVRENQQRLAIQYVLLCVCE